MKDWKKTLVNPDSTILNAIKAIDNGGIQIALVVDGEQRLLGTVTDGDIRRGILRGLTLQDKISNVMVSKPFTMKAKDDAKKIFATMKKKELRQIPILDDGGRLIRLEVFEDLLKGNLTNQIIFMAGGQGSRLLPLTESCPKPLLTVGDKPLLETTVSKFIESGFSSFTMAVNYKAEMFQMHFGDGSKWGCDIKYIFEEKPMGTAGALTLLPEKPTKAFFVMNADLLTNMNFLQLLEFHIEQKAKATMCIREYELQVPYGVVNFNEDHFSKIDEKPIQKYYVNAGIYIFEPEVLSLIPKNQHYNVTDLFSALKEKNEKISVFPIREYWIDVGQIHDFHKANGEFDKHFK